MKYSEAIKQSMEKLARDEKVVFIGYSLTHGCATGTLKDIPDSKKYETPIAENLMIGLGMGMSLEGFRPLVYFERFDFVLNAMDGIVNHLDKIDKLSKGQFNMPVIMRVVVGSKTPLLSGLPHIQDHTEALRMMVSFPILTPKTSKEVIRDYDICLNSKTPIMVVEQRDLYGVDFNGK